MKIESSNPTLTELEGAVLATIADRGPMTAYAIKEVFRASPSSFWSGSAGAVYPLMKRLEVSGLLVSRDESASRRPKREFALTDSGQDKLLVWLTDVERAVNAGYDPLRTRTQFSHLLDADCRRRFFDAVEQAIPAMSAPPQASPRLEKLHAFWVAARQTWFSRFRGLVDKD